MYVSPSLSLSLALFASIFILVPPALLSDLLLRKASDDASWAAWHQHAAIDNLGLTVDPFSLFVTVDPFSLFVVVGSLYNYPIPKREDFLFLGYWGSQQ